ncbi:MAG: DUF6588 family protein [Bdellovibrionales bacterium]
MKVSIHRALILIATLIASSAGAQDLKFQNLNREDFEKVVRELSANFMHTSVSGAGTLGSIFGFELGVLGGVTRSSEVEKLAREVDPEAEAAHVPHGALFGVLTVPAGLTVETALIPKVGSKEFKFNLLSLAVKWTPTELLFDWPLSLAIEGSVSKANLEFEQTLSGVATNFDYGSTVTAFTVFVSKNFAIIEPYAGLGIVSGKGNLDVEGSTTVFDATYTQAQSASEKRSSAVWMLGTEVKLLVLKLGLEYARLMDTSRYTGKVAFYF